MTTSDTHVAVLLDTVCHEMDSMVHNNHTYKSVCSPIIGEQHILERSLSANLHNKVLVVVIKDSQVVSHCKLFMGHMVFYYTKGFCCL